MKVMSWKEEGTGIQYRAALVLNKATANKELQVERQVADFTGQLNWVKTTKPDISGIIEAVLANSFTIEGSESK